LLVVTLDEVESLIVWAVIYTQWPTPWSGLCSHT